MKYKKNIQKTSPEHFNQTPSKKPKAKHILRLYIAGKSNRSILAITNLKKICAEHLVGSYDLEVIDLFQYPARAKEEQIIAAPTLIKKSPLPFRRIIGDMSNKKKVLLGLDLKQ